MEAHFAWDGPFVRGLTAVSRTTTDVLRMNLSERMEHRRLPTELGVFAAPQKAQARQRSEQQRTWLRNGDAVGDEDAGGAAGESDVANYS